MYACKFVKLDPNKKRGIFGPGKLKDSKKELSFYLILGFFFFQKASILARAENLHASRSKIFMLPEK